ncbi:MAG: DUF6261 family protein [Tannerella sp.]|jgi:hypothetical protein|nr:DUF6261 family protein [Tannerella sp.]
MKKLIALRFKQLPFSAHFDFFVKLSGLLTSAGDALRNAVAALMTDFSAWLTKEESLMQWIRKSILTEWIAEADRQIDRLLVGINALVKASLHSTSATTRNAAHKIQIMLKQYGRISRESYDEEAGDVRAIIEQFDGPYAAEVTTLGLTNWVNDLSTAFEHFEDLLRRRETERSAKPPCTTREVRKGIEDVYHQMVEIINANSVANTSPDFAAFIDILNPDIERLNAEFARSQKDLGRSDHTVVDPIDTQQYTGKPVTPLPLVHYREEGKPAAELIFGKDFTITYRNNVHTGTAELTIHGRGSYRGAKTVTFNIIET